MQHTKMVHVFLNSNGGVILRSRFWLGSELRPYAPAPIARLAARVLNRPAVRRVAVPSKAPGALARHCAEEYANLAALLPELYGLFADTA
jgi:DAPG hydrolase PhiG domain